MHLAYLVGIVYVVSGYCAPIKFKTSQIPSAAALKFMKRYGYMRADDGNSEALYTQSGISDNIKLMQKYGGLRETGDFNEETLKLITLPRCGVPDINISNRKRRYILAPDGWNKRYISYFIVNWAPTLGENVVQKSIKKALDIWGGYGNLHFYRKNSSDADIIVEFAIGYHGDYYPFDGPGRILAHAFFPYDSGSYGGDIHFDAEEKWIDKMSGIDLLDGTDFYTVALHELGHSLGLAHSPERTSIMFPYYQNPDENISLGYDDILAMYELYIRRILKEDIDLATSKTRTEKYATSQTTTNIYDYTSSTDVTDFSTSWSVPESEGFVTSTESNLNESVYITNVFSTAYEENSTTDEILSFNTLITSTEINLGKSSYITNVPSTAYDVNLTTDKVVDLNGSVYKTNVSSTTYDVNWTTSGILSSNTYITSTENNLNESGYITNVPSTAHDVNWTTNGELSSNTFITSTEINLNESVYTTNVPSTMFDINCTTNKILSSNTFVTSTEINLTKYIYTTNVPSTTYDVDSSTEINLNKSVYSANVPIKTYVGNSTTNFNKFITSTEYNFNEFEYVTNVNSITYAVKSTTGEDSIKFQSFTEIPTTTPYLENYTLTYNNDEGNVGRYVTFDSTHHIPSTDSPSLLSLCDGQFDTLATLWDELFVFRDEYVWRFQEKGSIVPGYPVKLSTFFFKLPQYIKKIDAAYQRSDGTIILFTENVFWIYDGEKILDQSPEPLINFGLPEYLTEIDAVQNWQRNRKTYFFKNDIFWRYNEITGEMDYNYPQHMERWRGVPTFLDAAITWKDGITYFFKDGLFWELDNYWVIVTEESPLPTSLIWFGCTEDNIM